MSSKPLFILAAIVVASSVLMPMNRAGAQSRSTVAANVQQKMPIRSAQMKAAGQIGGEGAQWPRGDLAVSPSDPNFLLLPIDVGGLYRSLDGGATWNIAMQGWHARGANAFAIDPKNANRVVGVAGNSTTFEPGWGVSPHGLYLSTDKAASWKQVAARPDAFGACVAYDPNSYDAAKKFSTRAYYLSTSGDLFRSDDGGQNWRGISLKTVTPGVERDWTLGGTFIARVVVHPADHTVYVAGRDGFFRSKDGGETFAKTRDGATFGLDIAPDGTLWIADATGVHSSRDSGTTWTKAASKGLDLSGQFAANVHVSPADPRRLLAWVPGANWQWKRYVSHDSGATWKVATLDASQSVLPTNARQGFFAWHPTNPNIAWSIGGDWVSKSTDGGQSFRWSNNGYNGVMSGSFFFSPFAPKVTFLGFQDYNSAFTLDGGQSWTYCDSSGLGWGGHCYGAGQVDQTTMWYGDAEGWGAPRRLKMTSDGGKTWHLVNGADGKPLVWKGADVSFVHPTNPRILFASNFRSADEGATWQTMNGCDGVYTTNGTTLIGRKDKDIVSSKDDGLTWTKVVSVDGGFGDIAFDAKRNRYLVASQERLKIREKGVWRTIETPRDQYGNQRIDTVAVDPGNSDIVYGGGPRNIYMNGATIVRSTDGGATWENLTSGSGAHEVGWVRVHPTTHEAWLMGQCFGVWRLSPPTKLGAANPALANAPLALAAPLLKARTAS